MSATANKKSSVADQTKLGEHCAMQPLSGKKKVDETFAVLGNGRGGYVRHEETDQDKVDKLK